MNKEEREAKEKRLGWISVELGHEDFEIGELKRKLVLHEGRRRELERASEKLVKELDLETAEKEN